MSVPFLSPFSGPGLAGNKIAFQPAIVLFKGLACANCIVGRLNAGAEIHLGGIVAEDSVSATETNVAWAIATSGRIESAGASLRIAGIDPGKATVITRDQVRSDKSDPDLFLAAAEKLSADITASVVVGDSVWDLLAARRAKALGIGLLSGGYGQVAK